MEGSGVGLKVNGGGWKVSGDRWRWVQGLVLTLFKSK